MQTAAMTAEPNDTTMLQSQSGKGGDIFGIWGYGHEDDGVVCNRGWMPLVRRGLEYERAREGEAITNVRGFANFVTLRTED